MRVKNILSVYSSGLCELVLTALGAAIAILMVMQIISQAMGVAIDAEAILLFSWQGAVFLGLWPGQTFWTIRRRSSCGFEHSIIGVPSDDDMRVANHRRARALRR